MPCTEPVQPRGSAGFLFRGCLMAWTNALLIGSCSLSYELNFAAATLVDLLAAGITIDTTGGVITATWDGVTGSPGELKITVTPSYDIHTLPARIAALSVNSPFLGAKSFVDGSNYDAYQFS